MMPQLTLLLGAGYHISRRHANISITFFSKRIDRPSARGQMPYYYDREELPGHGGAYELTPPSPLPADGAPLSPPAE